MKHILVLLFLSIWAVALAQAPSEEQESGIEEQAEAQQAAGGDQEADEGGENEGEVNDDEAVEERTGEPLEGLPPEVETNPIPDPPEQNELSEADEEFEPGEEISEDYPVPLPSDI